MDHVVVMIRDKKSLSFLQPVFLIPEGEFSEEKLKELNEKIQVESLHPERQFEILRRVRTVPTMDELSKIVDEEELASAQWPPAHWK